MIGCQKCGVQEGAGDGLRVLPHCAEKPDSRWDWLALCRPCLEGEVIERKLLGRCYTCGSALATPTWDEAPQLNGWHRRMLGEVTG